jgi:hypothetical protein
LKFPNSKYRERSVKKWEKNRILVGEWEDIRRGACNPVKSSKIPGQI